MPKTENRSYKKSIGKHRDARCFFIVAEGEREDAYFSWFERKSRRIKVEIVPRETMGSAPKNMLARLQKFLPENAVEPGDQIWFVLDIDRWKRESIEDLRNLCAGYQGWGMAISNPCFEVWLYFHKGDPRQLEAKNPKDFKRLLDTLHPSGYSVEHFAPLIPDAALTARQADITPDHDYPNQWATTKVYKLAEEMLKFLGNNWV